MTSNPGRVVYENSTLVTGPLSKLQCVFANGLMVSMGASSFFTVGKVRIENGTATTQLFLGPGIFRIRATDAVSATGWYWSPPTANYGEPAVKSAYPSGPHAKNDYDVLLEQLPNFEVVPALLEVVGQSMMFGPGTRGPLQRHGRAMDLREHAEKGGACVYYPQSMYQESGKAPVVGNASDLLRRWLSRIKLDDKAHCPSSYPGSRRKSPRKSMDLMMKSNRRN